MIKVTMNGMAMVSEKELCEMEVENLCMKHTIEQMEERIKKLQKALIQSPAPTGVEIELAIPDFLAVYNHYLEILSECDSDAEQNPVYGKSVWVSWNGYKCDCGDGAVPCNYIISELDSVWEECFG